MIKDNEYWKFIDTAEFTSYESDDGRIIYINHNNEVILLPPSGGREILNKKKGKKTYIYKEAVKVMVDYINKDIEKRRK